MLFLSVLTIIIFLKGDGVQTWENLAGKARGVLALLHLLKNSGLNPNDLDFVIECSEKSTADVGQRAGGNFSKVIAEVAGCTEPVIKMPARHMAKAAEILKSKGYL